MNDVDKLDEDINSSSDEYLETISGRYPEEGFTSDDFDQIIYILDGFGKLYFENKRVKFVKGDALFIEKNEKYYFKTDYCLAYVNKLKDFDEKIKKLIR